MQKSMQSLNEAGMYIECVCSKEQKNSLGNYAKGCSGPSQKRTNGLQSGLWTISESNDALEHSSGSQKDYFFLAGPVMGEATDTLK